MGNDKKVRCREPVVLVVLDGFGIGKDSPYNAIKNAKMPFYNGLIEKYPHSQLVTHGESVGLPRGVMGNSEVGHMTMGAGRIIYQDLTRISNSIKSGAFFQNAVLISTMRKGAENNGRVHLVGLLSNGGVHSHIDHLFALMELATNLQIPKVSLHLFLDGRDTSPYSSIGFIDQLLCSEVFQKKIGENPVFHVGSLMGRFWAMDRDKRWERIERAYRTLTGQTDSTPNGPPLDIRRIIENSHQNGKSDEFFEPVLLDKSNAMQAGDSVIFFNFRADRARELSEAITEPDFNEFQVQSCFRPSAFTGLTQFNANLRHVTTAFPPQSFEHGFGEVLDFLQLKQLRIAETEKYAHVTFFFNGGRERPFIHEERILVSSPRDVVTYDLKPEMSALEVAQRATEKIETGNYDFVLMNFANADMVGHTGNYEAAVKAMETLDTCLSKVVGACHRSNSHVVLTADHGNAEEMRDERGMIHTQHTLNPVPAVWVPPNSAIAPKSSRLALKDGTLADLMPTLCSLMGIAVPSEVTGECLLPD